MNTCINIKPVSGALGAYVNGIDLTKTISPKTLKFLQDTLLDYLVLVFPNQNLTPKQFLKIARQFGKPDIYPFLQGLDGFPMITEVLKRVHLLPTKQCHAENTCTGHRLLFFCIATPRLIFLINKL